VSEYSERKQGGDDFKTSWANSELALGSCEAELQGWWLLSYISNRGREVGAFDYVFF